MKVIDKNGKVFGVPAKDCVRGKVYRLSNNPSFIYLCVRVDGVDRLIAADTGVAASPTDRCKFIEVEAELVVS